MRRTESDGDAVSFLDDCLAIVEPGYEAPRAQKTFEATQPRITPAYDLCKTCGLDEKRTGRSECEDCIEKSESGAKERERRAAVCRDYRRQRSDARAAARLSMMAADEAAAHAAKIAKQRASMWARDHREAKKKTCACGRPLPCDRRMCR